MVLFIFLFIVAVIVVVTVWVEFHEVVSPIKVMNPEGEGGTALVIYQKGLRDFQPKVVFAFAEGLISNDWRVEVTTVSSRAPTNIFSYDLLVIGWPTYWFTPSLPIRRYLRRIGDLNGKNTVIICTAAGAPISSCKKMKALVQAAKGNIVKTLTLFTMRPNENNRDPVEIATRVGNEIPPPRGTMA
jgi:flavorubredoxin